MNDTGHPLVTFVVPLYYTGVGVERLLEAFANISVRGNYDLVLVNDGSTDDTLARVQQAMRGYPVPITLVDLARNFGEHAAVLEGFRHARGEYVINLDDDLQNPISEALNVLEKLQSSGADVVYTWYAEKQHHWFRNFGSWLTNQGASFLLGKPKDLYLSSFRGLRQELVQRITTYRGPYPYIDGLILAATNRIEKLQVGHAARSVGTSGYTLRKLLRLWMNMFFNFSIMPLRLASLLGVALCGIGVVALGIVLWEYFYYGTTQAGWGSLMAAIAIFSGSQLLILGILGEYVGRSYLTLSGKPQSLVRNITTNSASTNLDPVN